MTNWTHVKSDHNRALLEGRIPADRINLSIALDVLLNEQDADSTDMDVPENIFYDRAQRMDWAFEACRRNQLGLALAQIRAFYLV